MRRRLGALLCIAGPMLSVGAPAETYRIVDGSLEGMRRSDALTGTLHISVFEPGDPAFQPSLLVDDFRLEAGDAEFAPRQLVEFEGHRTLWLEIADHIQFDGDSISFAYLRSGGDLVAADADEVTFRFVDFRADESPAGTLEGQRDTLLPRRISLRGTLYEVEQRFRLPPEGCEAPSVPLPDDGGDVSIGVVDPPIVSTPSGDGGSVTIVAGGGSAGGRLVPLGSFDIGGAEIARFEPPDGGGALLTRVTGGGSISIEGALETGGSVELLDPSGSVFGGSQLAARRAAIAAAGPSPTLEELGITAPSGADLSFDETGALTIRSDGDLLLEGGVIDVPGLTSLTLIALGSISVEGALELPPDVSLSLTAGEFVIAGEIELPPRRIPLERRLILCGLLPVVPTQELEVGSFSFVAAALQPVEIDVLPPGQPGRVPWHHRGRVSVAILGSTQLDVRDVDERSLRLGPHEAEPIRRGRGRGHRADVNRDGEPDLVATFDAEATGVANGDGEVCLFGETHDGGALEGCDAIRTRPATGPSPARRAPGRSRSIGPVDR